jgi:hypothetical protein
LPDHEAAAVFAALDPLFKPNAQGQYRGPANYRGGDNPKAFSVGLSRGGSYFDHVAGQGGDVVAYAPSTNRLIMTLDILNIARNASRLSKKTVNSKRLYKCVFRRVRSAP